MRSAESSRAQVAFTMIEILVAMMIFSLVIVAIYSSWSAILKGTQIGIVAAADAQRARATVRILQDSLASAQMYVENNEHYAFEALSEGQFASLSFVTQLSRSFPRSGRFPGRPIRRVFFGVENSPEGSKQLVLRQQPLLMDMDINEQETPLRLARDVSEFFLEFYNIEEEIWETEWVLTNQLPQVVRFTLGYGGDGRSYSQPAERVQRSVYISAAAIPIELQAPARTSGRSAGGRVRPPSGGLSGGRGGRGADSPGGIGNRRDRTGGGGIGNRGGGFSGGRDRRGGGGGIGRSPGGSTRNRGGFGGGRTGGQR